MAIATRLMLALMYYVVMGDVLDVRTGKPSLHIFLADMRTFEVLPYARGTHSFDFVQMDSSIDGWALALPSSSPPAGAPPQATSHHAVFVAAPELSAANESACTLPSLLPHSPRRGD
uniref:Uncharacterized protein n=1 Tax=Oryza barthii TaxID=65489 RepID=A0A0D3GLS5_9ORYZ